MEKPKIFYLATSLNIGGTEKFLTVLAENLSENYDITVGVVRGGGTLEAHLIKNGIQVIHCPLPWQLTGYLRLHKIKILHTFLFWAHIYGRLAAKFAGTPVVITTQQAVDTWKKFYHTFLDKLTAPLCDFFIVNSITAAKRLETVEKVPKDRIGLVYNGVDLGTFQTQHPREEIRKEFNIAPNAFVVACVSRLHYDKGVDFLPEIAAGSPGCVFLVAGDGPYMRLLKDKIKSMKLEGHVILCGWRLDTPRILKASDAFILPSREESFPQAALEAMAMRLPVVAADVGGVNELIEDGETGTLVKRGDTAGFSAAINRLINDRVLCSRFAEASYNKSLQFSESKMVQSVTAVYDAFLSKTSSKTVAG